ncbi:MAG: aspartate aminotransferase family protein [Gammaproteobacteria bacterium]
MTQPLMQTYARQPLTFSKGEGAWLWDEAGERYLDAVGGIAVCALGHAHPEVAAAVSEQAGRLIHTSNLYGVHNQAELAARLCALSGMESAFFCNSGAEANEAALKIARLYGHGKGVNNPQIVVMDNSFHGRTLATLTATGNPKVRAGFEPLVPGFIRVPFDDIAALEKVASNNQDVVAVLLEPIQGEGGINMPSSGYLSAVRELCDEHGWLMMLDEVQTGMGRTGEWFYYQHEQAAPDVLAIAKALGNGVPIGACLARGAAAQIFGPGNHGSTFGGNPLACRAALTVIDIIERENLRDKAAATGAYMLDRFRQRLHNVHGIANIRGQGMMIGIELEQPCGGLVERTRGKRLLINVTAQKVIRLLPPLIISEAEADTIVDTLCETIVEFLSNDG